MSVAPPFRNSAQRQPFKTERAGDRKPFKPKPWSHQRDLEALKGKKLQIVFHGGVFAEGISGILLEADQFSLKVEIHSEDRQSVLTVFKSDIRFYRAV